MRARRSKKPDSSGRPYLRWLAWVLAASSAVFWATAIFFLGGEDFVVVVSLGLVAVGTVVATKRTTNPIGWLLLGSGWLLSLSNLLSDYEWEASQGNADPVLGSWAAWGSRLTGGVLVAFLLIVFLPLIFPEGRLPSPRWKPILWLAFIALGLSMAGELLDPTTWEADSALSYPLPFALPSRATGFWPVIGPVVFVPLFVAVVVSIVIKFRRSEGLQRQQFKWVALPALLLVVFAVIVVLDGLAAGSSEPFGSPSSNLLAAVAGLTWLLGIVGLPVGVGFAVLRYRLYEIDRLLSRTVTYALVAGALGAVFALVAIAVPQLLGMTGEAPPLLVAAATLAVAALFNPLRRRVQTRVDRRFNRARYDAQREVEDFAERLRSEMEMEDLTNEVLGVVTKTVQPASAAIWVREEA